MKVRFIFYVIGLILLTMGVSLIIKSQLGASAWDALAVGQSNLFEITVGTCVFINGIVLIFLNAFLMKKKPEVLAALSILVIGIMIDFWLLIAFEQLLPATTLLKWVVLLAGIAVTGIGVSIYLQAKFPASPMDTLMVAIQTRFGFNLRNSRILSESFALLLAILFRGAIGIGTIVVTLTLGFVVQFFYPKFEHLLQKWQGVKR
ncbi:YczE/YyaS/YitT family protein [Cytobacillus gottheilii]|uniref:YczE/YyaS/YitT family protein n=1 Tax=Cytobacillus gottheilii TaxID=859144 RepID=UPI0009B9F4E4|nr:YitT family protein [Cytobacillus gottheilii]